MPSVTFRPIEASDSFGLIAETTLNTGATVGVYVKFPRTVAGDARGYMASAKGVAVGSLLALAPLLAPAALKALQNADEVANVLSEQKTDPSPERAQWLKGGLAENRPGFRLFAEEIAGL